MSKRLGVYITKKSPEESYKAFVPAALPPDPTIDLASFYNQLEQANLELAELKLLTQTIPNTTLFLYMFVRKEALLSSQIEGTQSSFSDLILFEHDQKVDVSLDDVEEVSNYVKAIAHGLKRLRNGFPLSLRLLKEMHQILLSGSRGADKLPGELRRTQNWIGGTRPGNALFVPPPVEELMTCLSDFEKFLQNDQLPLLIKAGLAHVQFETIHPFLDGNGRLGRLLITLLLCENGALNEPILYSSLYLKTHRETYYRLLQEVRETGAWEAWLEFFLEGIMVTTQQTVKAAQEVNTLFATDLEKIASLGRARFTCEAILSYLQMLPQVSVPLLVKELGLTAPAVRKALNTMVEMGIIEEATGKKRDKVYVYASYLTILEAGAEPIQE